MAQDDKAASASQQLNPDQRKLTGLQAKRLGQIAGIDAKQIGGLSVAEISDKLKWRIDPELLFFRRICGKVVKKDPVTGVEYPVPFATVIVEDTDCSLLAYFPPGWKFTWFYPLFCHREKLATVKTDACGRFCVYIPWFDIDWILRWRRERICFPDIFVRPDLDDLIQVPDLVVPHRPGDPGPVEKLAKLPIRTVEALAGAQGKRVAQAAADAQAARSFGARAAGQTNLAGQRAFADNLPPPLPHEFRHALAGGAGVLASKDASPHDAVRGAIATQLGVEHGVLKQLDLNRFIGPFRRCIDIFVPTWQLVFDVPDITFRVTQDTNGDGIEETIYSEGYFDVRWDAGTIPDVTLVASSSALESHLCDTPNVPCKDVPELLFAGLMPLTDPAYFNAIEGYALRPNRPIPPSGPRPAAKTPFLGTLQLYGCVNVPGASFYRVMASTDDGASFSAITGLGWNIYPIPSGPPHPVSSDADGWYPVLPNPNDFHPANMVLEWPTPPLGKVILKIELGNAAKAVLPIASNVVAIQVDNTAPTVLFNQLAWKFSSEPDSAFGLPGRNLLVPCPTIRRGASPADIEVQFDVSVNAHHLRDTYLYSHGCGGGDFALTSPVANTTHWHTTVNDNSVLLSGRYRLDHSALEGAYGFGCRANSRAMNPAGGDGGHLVDWLYDPVYAYAQPEVEIAVVNG